MAPMDRLAARMALMDREHTRGTHGQTRSTRMALMDRLGLLPKKGLLVTGPHVWH